MIRSGIWLLAISFLLFGAPHPADGAAAPSQDEAVRAVHAELERLDQALQRVLIRAGRNAADGRTVPHLADEAERFASRLGALEAEVHRLGAEELLQKVEQLRALAGNLTRVAERPSDAARPAYSQRWPRALAGAASGSLGDPSNLAPSNDACSAAPTVGFGTVSGTTDEATLDGEASCGSSLFTPDVWFHFVAPQSGAIYVDTFGSSYDTVISVHSDCPGTIAGEVTCNDDTFGLQSATSFYAYSGQEFWIRVSGVNGATGDYQLQAGEGGSVSGTAKDAVTGDPVPYCYVRGYDGDGYYIGSAWLDSDGRYSLFGLGLATYFFRLTGCAGYLGELYDDIPCYEGSCDPLTGTPVVVTSGSTIDGVDFTLDAAGRIAGTVTETSTGNPISGVRIEIRDGAGDDVTEDYTDINGEYAVDGLAPGDYFAVAESSFYHEELYDDIPCPGGAPSGCDATSGTPIPVAVGATVAGIDFVLTRLAAVTGTVTDAATTDPIPWVDVKLFNASGSYIKNASTAADGTYEIGGLGAGTYYLTATHYPYARKLYDDLPCPDDGSCEPTSGTPVVVTADSITGGVDFALDRRGGLTGEVTRASDGTPVSYARVELFTETGVFWDSYHAGYTGDYEFDVLPDGNYFAVAEPYPYSTPSNLIEELYDGILCPGGAPSGCDPTDGTPIAVALGGLTTADFSLETGGSLSGTVTEAVTGDPIAGAVVRVWDSGGTQIGFDTTDAYGTYVVTRLLGGSFYATVWHNNYGGELYPDLPCPDGGCDPTSGTPIAVSLGFETPGIDFALSRKGSITGTVTQAVTGEAIQGIYVRVYDELGSQVSYAQTQANGAYEVGGLDGGIYYVATSDHSAYRHQVYDGVPCTGSCQPTTGTPVAVGFGAATPGIDFVLDKLGVISGTVYDSKSGAPIWADVELYDAEGHWVDYSYDSSYTFSSLQPGTYYLFADDYDYAPEIYQEMPCGPGLCEATSGTPVVVALNQEVTGIDFTLDRYGSIRGVVTDEAGLPIEDAFVRAYDATNVSRSYGYAGSDGLYYLDDLPPGTYYVTASRSGYLGELYDDIPCLGGTTSGCAPNKGTPVVVFPATTTRHVNFALQSTGGGGGGAPREIRGTVTDDTGQPLANVVIDLWYDSGDRWGSAITGPDGTYAFQPYSGTWYVSTDNPYGRVDQVYDGVACPAGSAFAGRCDPTQGMPIFVPSSGLVEGIDFILGPGKIFTDGFESGNVSAWSSALGGGS